MGRLWGVWRQVPLMALFCFMWPSPWDSLGQTKVIFWRGLSSLQREPHCCQSFLPIACHRPQSFSLPQLRNPCHWTYEDPKEEGKGITPWQGWVGKGCGPWLCGQDGTFLSWYTAKELRHLPLSWLPFFSAHRRKASSDRGMTSGCMGEVRI